MGFKRETEWMKLEDEVRNLRIENVDLKELNSKLMKANNNVRNDLGNMQSVLDHLLESKFIRSFRMLTGNGNWVRPIDEADRIAYGNNVPPSDGGVFELQEKLKESNSGEDLHIINNHKVIIIRFDRIQTIEYKESLTALFKDQGIVCIILDRCEIDYIC